MIINLIKIESIYDSCFLTKFKLLRELTVSSCVHSLSSDWKKAKFAFRHRESELTYGLYSEKVSSTLLVFLEFQQLRLTNYL